MTDTARDVIARALRDDFGPFGPRAPSVYADSLIEALHTAGYRILAPGELDWESLKRCAKVADTAAKNCNWIDGVIEAENIAAAIRSLKGVRNA